MIEKDIQAIDELIGEIKNTQNANEEWNFCFIISLEIIRYELMKNKSLSDKTGDAIVQFFSFQSFEYYRDFPKIHEKTGHLLLSLAKYNKRLKENDARAIGPYVDKWINYYYKIFKYLLVTDSKKG